MRRITIGGVSITTAATHVCVLCMRYCNGLIAYVFLHYLMKFHLEVTKDKEMTTFLYVLSDHPTYKRNTFHAKTKSKSTCAWRRPSTQRWPSFQDAVFIQSSFADRLIPVDYKFIEHFYKLIESINL